VDSSWRLLGEIGLEYVQDDASGAAGSVLRSPIAAERMPDGALLVVDDISARSPQPRPLSVLPPRRWRTLVLGTGADANRVLFDSAQQGIESAFGARCGEDRIALLRCRETDIVVLGRTRLVERRIDLAGISAHPPGFLSCTERGGFLVAFMSEIGKLDIVELDGDGTLRWRYAGPHGACGLPASLQLLPNDSILVADEFHHVVQELRRDSSSTIRSGIWHQPSAAEGHLYGPRCARQLADGSLLIADTQNHRVLRIDAGGRSARLKHGEGLLVAPSSVYPLPAGDCLVCDAGNGCVVELKETGRPAVRAGAPHIRRRLLSLPRSVEFLGEGRYLIADTANNRVVSAEAGKLRDLAQQGSEPLFWPRAARQAGTGTLIADGRRSRVLELAADGRAVRELSAIRHGGETIALRDPHDARAQANGTVLIADAAGNFVAEADWSGETLRMVGRGRHVALKDPHSVQALADGRWLIADTGQHRVLFVDPDSGTCESLQELRQEGGAPLQFNYPRHAEIGRDGTLVVVDSGNHRVLVRNGARVRVLERVEGSPIPELRFPRWAQWVGGDELVVSDHSNHRVLHLRLTER
jgi:DNA-binding beta-propeller fold protein YncE